MKKILSSFAFAILLTMASYPLNASNAPADNSYCTPTTTLFSFAYITSFSTTGAAQNITNTSSSAPTAGYSDFTNLQCVQYAGDTIFVNITGNMGLLYKGYVDWNQDYDFTDEGETVFSTSSSSSNWNGSIAIPAALQAGTYRLRISGAFMDSPNNTACGLVQPGNFHDYTIVVLAAAGNNCVPPTALINNTTTPTGATISWTAPVNEPGVGYDIYCSTNNIDPDENTIPTETSAATTANLTDLNANTTYYVWVRANCDGSNFSMWIGPLSFTTQPSCNAPTNVNIENITTSSATISWTEVASATEYIIEYGITGSFVPGSGTASMITTPNTSELLQNLTPQAGYTVAIRTNCGNNEYSTWTIVTFATRPVETFGNNIWHGYVYQSANPDVWTDRWGAYLGYVEENPTFTRLVSSAGTWTGNNPVWTNNGTGPSDYFAVRYKMDYTFPCGNYLITLPNVDAAARLSIDGGNTWLSNLCFANNCGSAQTWEITNGNMMATYTANVYLSGLTHLVLEFYDNVGGSCIGFQYVTAGLGIIPDNLTPNSVDLTFSGGTEWNIKVASSVLDDPDNDPADILTTSTSIVPYTVNNLMPDSTYHIYAQTTCGSNWGHITITTPEACPIPSNLLVSNLTSNTATLSWDSLGQTAWRVKISSSPLNNPDTETADIVDDITNIASYTITQLTMGSLYFWYVQTNCGSDWANGSFTTPTCPEGQICYYTLHIGGNPGIWPQNLSWANGGYVYVKQNNIPVYSYVHPTNSTEVPNIDTVLKLCKNSYTTIEFYCSTISAPIYGTGFFTLKNSNDVIVYSATQSGIVYQSPAFLLEDNCSICEPPVPTWVNVTDNSFAIAFTDNNPHDIKVSSQPIDPENENGDIIPFEINTTDNPYEIQGLSPHMPCYVYVSESGSCWSPCYIMGTRATETYGIDEWNGYVYAATGNSGMWGYGNFYGLVTEPAEFTRNVGDGQWTGTSSSWEDTAPVDNFVVHYKMKKDFACGFYTFSIGTDDHVRFSINDSLIMDWSTENGIHTLDPVFLSGETYLDFEFHEGIGDAVAHMSYAVQPTGIIISNVLGYSADISFAGGDSWTLKVSTIPLSDPATQNGNVPNYESVSINIPGPYSLNNLLPATHYYVYVLSDCNAEWGMADFTTAITCPVVQAVIVNNISETGADFTWTAGSSETTWSVVYGTPTDNPDNLPVSTVIATPAYTIAEGTLTSNTQYALWIKGHCGGIDNSPWKQQLFKTRCAKPVALTVSNITSSEATVSWSFEGDATEWVLEYKTEEATSWITVTPNPDTSVVHLFALSSETCYDVRVKTMCSSNDESEWNFTTFCTETSACIPPTNLQGTPSSTTITMSWTAMNGETSWKIDWGQGQTLINTNPYTITNLTQNTSYQVCIVAICSQNEESDPMCTNVATSGINSLNINNTVNLYPNPTTDKLMVDMSTPFLTVEITDILGQIIYYGEVKESTLCIDVSSYSANMYYIKLYGENGVVIKKFVKR